MEKETLRPTKSVQKGDIEAVKAVYSKAGGRFEFGSWEEMEAFADELTEISDEWTYYTGYDRLGIATRTLQCVASSRSDT